VLTPWTRDPTRLWPWFPATRPAERGPGTLLGVRDAPEFMDISDAVAADLAALTAALDDPDTDLVELVQRLGISCSLAVTSYLGFSISLVIDQVPVSVSVLEDFLDPSEILTSVMFPLSALGDHAPGGEVVLYAGTPGAFVDLAADVAYALRTRPDAVQLDRHRIPPDPALGAVGLTALSRHNQAIGILLDRGHDPDEALTELHRLARQDAISLQVAVQQLIDSTVRPPAG
jgi:hypothetical protein